MMLLKIKWKGGIPFNQSEQWGYIYLSSIEYVAIDVACDRLWFCCYLIGRDQVSGGLFWANLNVGALLLVIDLVLLLVINGDDVAIWWYDYIVLWLLFAVSYWRCDLLN